jgi:hypothetical protein
MHIKRKTGLIFGLLLIAMSILTMSTSCSRDETALQGNQPLAATTQKSIQTPQPLSSPTSTLFPEPSVKPTALPSSAKWNPYTGDWYDSSEIEPDPVTHKYRNVPRTIPPGYIPPKGASITGEEWIAQHKDSTDEIDIAMISYHQELVKVVEKRKKEDPYWMIRSNIPIGAEEGGPLTILTDLGMPKLQALLDRVQWENPFVYYLEVAINRITRRTITHGGDGSWDYQVNAWKKDFNDQASSAKSQVDGIALDLAENQADAKSIEVKFARMGILALPEVYELVINQANTDLIKYIPDILPLDKMKAYNIQAGQTADETLKQALKSCSDDIKIIQTLHTDQVE